MKPQPDADGAIRARIQFREGSKFVAVQARRTPAAAATFATYKLQIEQSFASLLYFPGGPKGIELGRYALPKRLQPGDTVLLELRVQGDLLTALMDGAVVIEARDSHLPGPGEWGIIAADGWFESVEVQTLLPAAPSAQTAAATKDAPFVNALGMKFVPVSIVGGPTDGRRVLFSVWETRVQDYEVFAAETKRPWEQAFFEQGPAHPAVKVTWDNAQAFCIWLTERERQAGRLPAGALFRLPSDHEWSCAVGIATQEDPAKLPGEKSSRLVEIYPWGGTWPAPDDAGNYSSAEAEASPKGLVASVVTTRHDGYGTTAPVGSYRANPLGLYDLGGNVWEWCEDWMDHEKLRHVMRGASFSDGIAWARSACRTSYTPGSKPPHGGFRCVLEVAAPPTAASSPAVSAADGWKDLFAKLTPELVAQTGQGWRLEGGLLLSPAKRFATLPLPGSFAGASYQVRVRLRQLTPKEVFHVVLPVGDRVTGFDLDGFQGRYTGLSTVNGASGKDLPGVLEGRQVKDSGPHDLEVTVRLDGANVKITTTLDTHPLYEWTGPVAALDQLNVWATDSPGSLALSTIADDWVVSEVKVKRLDAGK